MSRQADPDVQAFFKEREKQKVIMKKEEIQEKKHAKWAPSASKRNLNCPGSLALSLTVPVPPASPYALEGTKAHEFGERLLRVETRQYSTKSEKDRIIQSILQEITDEEMLIHVTGYRDFVLKVRGNFLKKHDDKYFEFIEERLEYSKDMYGTADYALVSGKAGLLIDLKYGAGEEVEARDNTQLMCYALMLLKKFPELEIVHIFIYQPRVGDKPHDRFDVSASDLKKFEKVVDKGIKTSFRIVKDGCDVEHLKEGDWCVFCPAWSVCSLKLKAVEEKALTLFDDETHKNVPAIPIDRLIGIWRKKKEITKVLDEIDSTLEGYLLGGNSHPELKLVTVSGRRGWAKSLSDDDIIANLKAMGIKKPYTIKPIGITEAEKLAKKQKRTIDDLVEKSPDRPGLALSTDRRPEWDLSNKAISMFEVEHE